MWFDDENKKQCTKCKQIYILSDFSKDKYKKDGLCSWCKNCHNKCNKQDYLNNKKERLKKNARGRDKYQKTPKSKEYRRKYKLKNKYNITVEDYDEMLKLQSGKCVICDSEDPGGKGIFCVDHNHLNNKIRGLLCFNCNIILGHCKDSITVLLKAIKYLKEHKLNEI